MSDEPFTFLPPEERRAHPRYEILAQVRFKRGAITHVMDVNNISRSGLFVSVPADKTLARIRTGDELELHVFATDELENIHVVGRVVRIVADGEPRSWGFGVHFVSATGEAERALVQLVEKAAKMARVTPRPPPLPGSGTGHGP